MLLKNAAMFPKFAEPEGAAGSWLGDIQDAMSGKGDLAEFDGFQEEAEDPASLSEEEWLADGEVPGEEVEQGQEQQAEGEAKQEAKPAVAGPKEFVLTGEDGKRYKAKLDLSNEKQVQGVLQEAMLVPALKAKLEQANAQAAEASEMRAELAEIQTLGEEKGIAGIVDFLMDEEGHFEKFIESERQRRNLLDSAEPHERDEAKRLADIDARERKVAAMERRAQEAAKRAGEDKQSASQERMQSMFHNAWSKHDLSGTLGDPELEESLNAAAFEAINREVKERQEKGQPPTQADMHAIVERRFSILKRGLREGSKRAGAQDTAQAKAQASAAIASRVAPAPAKGSSSQAAMEGFTEGKLSFRDMVSSLFRK